MLHTITETITPSRQPITTCKCVCPTNSFKDSSSNLILFKPSMNCEISLIILFCLPVSNLTPDASCMTIIAIINANAKTEELKPSIIPIAVAQDETTAEWQLGMPPSPNKRLKSNFLYTQA